MNTKRDSLGRQWIVDLRTNGVKRQFWVELIAIAVIAGITTSAITFAHELAHWAVAHWFFNESPLFTPNGTFSICALDNSCDLSLARIRYVGIAGPLVQLSIVGLIFAAAMLRRTNLTVDRLGVLSGAVFGGNIWFFSIWSATRGFTPESWNHADDTAKVLYSFGLNNIVALQITHVPIFLGLVAAGYWVFVRLMDRGLAFGTIALLVTTVTSYYVLLAHKSITDSIQLALGI